MFIDLLRDQAKVFPPAVAASAITALHIWHCKYQSFAPLRQLNGLRMLKIAGFPDHSLECLQGMVHLEWLSICHLPKVTSLAPLQHLASLRYLSLETLPSWDASSKRTIVESLEPLVTLPRLEHVSLLGVLPADRSPSPLSRCGRLTSAELAGFPKAEVQRFFADGRIAPGHIPDPKNYVASH